jgi:hypothetical protein
LFLADTKTSRRFVRISHLNALTPWQGVEEHTLSQHRSVSTWTRTLSQHRSVSTWTYTLSQHRSVSTWTRILSTTPKCQYLDVYSSGVGQIPLYSRPDNCRSPIRGPNTEVSRIGPALINPFPTPKCQYLAVYPFQNTAKCQYLGRVPLSSLRIG